MTFVEEVEEEGTGVTLGAVAFGGGVTLGEGSLVPRMGLCTLHRCIQALVIGAAVLVTGAGAGLAWAGADSCVVCHRDPELLVTNKKLYDYYQQWDASVHKQEEVTCDDCHGGNPRARDKQAAHAEGVGAADPDSGVYFKTVPETCGTCHDEILEGFRQSHHFEHLEKIGDEKQGPTCVTCHGSINVDVLNVVSVAESCARCHNSETGTHPEIPEKARGLMNRFLSIHRFYRYVGIRAEPEEASAFFRELDPRLSRLSVIWHTFDVDAVDKETGEVLGILKAKRDEIRRRRSKSPAVSEPAD
jgi:hypothetical protein